jgi:hypothetical protein
MYSLILSVIILEISTSVEITVFSPASKIFSIFTSFGLSVANFVT